MTEELTMEGFVTKQEGKLYRGLEKLIGNCVDHFGSPKAPTVKQLQSAQKLLNEYTHYSNKTLREVERTRRRSE